MLGAIAEGTTHVQGFLEGQDALATLAAFRAMGVDITGPDDGDLRIVGVGLHGLRAPPKPIDLGNSGTAMRLMTGLLAGQSFASVLCGDESLSNRPMTRVAEPLADMGAVITTDDGGTPPVRISARHEPLRGIDYKTPMASAQVKSALLLAGLYSDGEVRVTEPAPTRDHTERMLRGFGYTVHSQDLSVQLSGGGRLSGQSIRVPGDFSSAAFFIVGALLAHEAELTIERVGLNPTRTGALEILRLMGAKIDLLNQRQEGGEPLADIRVCSSALSGIDVPAELVPLAIDEFPVLCVAAACAQGETRIQGAGELRVKESDRIETTAAGLRSLGIEVDTQPDGLTVKPGQLQGGQVDSHGDHRIAMAFAIASVRANAKISIQNCANVQTSFPNFVELAKHCGLAIEAV